MVAGSYGLTSRSSVHFSFLDGQGNGIRQYLNGEHLFHPPTLILPAR